MRHSKPVRLKTVPTGLLYGRRCFQLRRFNPPRHLPGGESVYLFLEFTIAGLALSVAKQSPLRAIGVREL